MTTVHFRSNSQYQTILNGFQREAAQKLARFKAARARRAAYRLAVSELSQLNNRDLADIGIHRSNIRQVAADHALKEYPYV